MELEQNPFVTVIEHPARRSGKPYKDFLVLYPYHFEMSINFISLAPVE
jgi:hypothetical protein